MYNHPRQQVQILTRTFELFFPVQFPQKLLYKLHFPKKITQKLKVKLHIRGQNNLNNILPQLLKLFSIKHLQNITIIITQIIPIWKKLSFIAF